MQRGPLADSSTTPVEVLRDHDLIGCRAEVSGKGVQHQRGDSPRRLLQPQTHEFFLSCLHTGSEPAGV